MKRTLCIALALVMAFALFTACNTGSNDGSSTAATPPPAAAPTQTLAPATPPPPPPEAEGWDFSDAKNVTLTFPIWLPEFDPTVVYLCNLLDAIKEFTEGTVDYTLYAGASLVNPDEQLDAVKNGLADFTFNSIAYYAGVLPTAYMLDIPGSNYANDLAASYAIDEWYRTLQLDELKDYQFMFGSGQGNGCFMSTVPMKTFEDFKGVQMRTSAVLVPVLESYGMIPSVIGIAEAYEAMRTNVIQGATAMVMAAHTFNFQDVAKYCTLDPFFFASYLIIMNKDTWNSFTDDQREAIDAAIEYAYPIYIAPGRQDEMDACLADFEAAGLEVIRLSDQEIAKMNEANGSLQQNQANSTAGGPAALALLKELIAKWNAIFPEYSRDAAVKLGLGTTKYLN